MTYPPLDNHIIWTVVEFAEAAKAEPEILTKNDCPYPSEFLEVIKSYVNKDKAKKVTGSSIEDLENQIAAIYDELDDFKLGLKADEEGQIFVSYMRLRGQLLAKMVEIKERVYNLKKLKEFENRVLRAIDQVMTAEQRTKFINVLGTNE